MYDNVTIDTVDHYVVIDGTRYTGFALGAILQSLARERDEAVSERKRVQAECDDHRRDREGVLEAYKIRVRDAVLEAQEDNGFCNEGVNRFLEGLGLQGVEREYEVQVVRTVSQTTYVNVEAVDEDEAEEKALREVKRDSDSFSWETDDYSADGYAVENVEES